MEAWGLNWFILVLWLGLTVIGLWKGHVLYRGASSILGMFWGLTLLSESIYVGFIMIIINLFVLFLTMFRT
jgi:hypothetical protein